MNGLDSWPGKGPVPTSGAVVSPSPGDGGGVVSASSVG